MATAGAPQEAAALPAAQPAARSLTGCWRLFAPVTASGCCRSVEPKETVARASTAQDGGSRVSVSVCGRRVAQAGRGAPSRSFRPGVGGAGDGWGLCGLGSTAGAGGASRTLEGAPHHTPPRGSSPALCVPVEQGSPTSPILHPGAWIPRRGSRRKRAQRGQGRRLRTVILGPHMCYV